jgi:tRNA modification GTPase
MALYAAVMTGKGVGAIATVQVFGDAAQGVLGQIFQPKSGRAAEFEKGKILLGAIVDGEKTIDQVTIGYEGSHTFAIHCHGNPLIVEMIMELLGTCGVELIDAEELLRKTLIAQKHLNTIAIEAKLAQLNAKTLAGTKIIANQTEGGLSAIVSKWLRDGEAMSSDRIAAEAEQILKNSQVAKLTIAGCTIILAGPPNSGKSTLLNRLAGRQKAIVTDIEGTTRDWVSAECQIGPLAVTLIDTAGLDEELAAVSDSEADKAAQKRTMQILSEAELVLLILDGSRPAGKIDKTLLHNLAGKKVLTVLNKSDLPQKLDIGKSPKPPGDTVQISAESGAGIESLKEAILHITGATEINAETAIAFTPRQEDLLKQLTTAKSNRQARQIISELLNGSLGV